MRVVALALGLGLALAGCKKERKESIELINEALAQEQAQSLSLAYSNYMRAATIDPGNHRAFFHMALVEILDRNEGEKGLAHLLEAEKLAPDDRDVVYHIGRYHAVQPKPDIEKALASLDKALQLDPNYAPAHYHRGVMLLAREDFRGADTAFREAIACDPTYGAAYRDLGLLYEQFDHDEAAMRVYEAGAQHAVDKVDVLNNLGLLLMRAGRTADAVNAFEKALQFAAARPDTIFNLAFAHVENGNPRQAFQYLAEFINRADLSQGEHLKVARLLKDAMEREIDKQRAIEQEKKALQDPADGGK
jgi:Flp pilus assembly protein TadD